MFLITREYMNLNNIIQKHPHELYLDPHLNVRRSYYKKRTKKEEKKADNSSAEQRTVSSLGDDQPQIETPGIKRTSSEVVETAEVCRFVKHFHEDDGGLLIEEVEAEGNNTRNPDDNLPSWITSLSTNTVSEETTPEDKGFVSTIKYVE